MCSKRNEWVLSSIAILISLISLYFSWYGTPGIVQPIRPNGYGIIRGIESFPSDHIVLPLEWENTSGKPIVIRNISLILKKLGTDGQETGSTYQFLLAGEYPEISSEAFKKPFVLKNSFVVDAKSIPQKVLVFHYKKFWDKNDKLYSFRFEKDQRFNVTIEFQPNLEKMRKIKLFDLPIYAGVDKLQTDRNKPWWDYFSLSTTSE